jgi:acid phosphatase (class A)
MLAVAVVVAVAALEPSQVRGQTGPATIAGYVSENEFPDMTRIVPAAPSTGDARFTADMRIFHATRSLEGSPRWQIAQADDELSIPALMKAFRCALGVELTPGNAPLVTKLLTRANADSSRASNTLKAFYGHKRPFQVEDGPVCVTPAGRARLETIPDYPSGHTTAGWEAGLVLASLAPDAVARVLARARAFGESRIVCGVHNASAVEAGWLTASSVFAVQQTSQAFRTDADAARAELRELRRASTEDAGMCARETEILAGDPF